MRERWRGERRFGWRKVMGANGKFANIYDSDGRLCEVEYYDPSGEFCGEVALTNVRIENEDGDIVACHKVKRISDDSYDIYVTDGVGNLHVILHHSKVSCGEPFSIQEEWVI